MPIYLGEIQIALFQRTLFKSQNDLITRIIRLLVYLPRYVIFGFGLGAALVLGLLFLVLIRTPGVLTSLVWSIIIAICFGLVAAGYYMKKTSDQWRVDGLKEEHEIKGLYWLSIIAYVGAGLWFVTICCIRKRIALAISCVKEASNAMSAMPIIIISPVFQVIGICAFLIPFGIFMTYLASSGEVKAECICLLDSQNNETIETSTPLLNETLPSSGELTCNDQCYLYKTFVYNRNTKYAGLYMVFVWFWTSQFIVALGELVIALSISMWYFTREKNKVGNSTYFHSFATASTYHLGTCAFGSLIIGKYFGYFLQYIIIRPHSTNVLFCFVFFFGSCTKPLLRQSGQL